MKERGQEESEEHDKAVTEWTNVIYGAACVEAERHVLRESIASQFLKFSLLRWAEEEATRDLIDSYTLRVAHEKASAKEAKRQRIALERSILAAQGRPVSLFPPSQDARGSDPLSIPIGEQLQQIDEVIYTCLHNNVRALNALRLQYWDAWLSSESLCHLEPLLSKPFIPPEETEAGVPLMAQDSMHWYRPLCVWELDSALAPAAVASPIPTGTTSQSRDQGAMRCPPVPVENCSVSYDGPGANCSTSLSSQAKRIEPTNATEREKGYNGTVSAGTTGEIRARHLEATRSLTRATRYFDKAVADRAYIMQVYDSRTLLQDLIQYLTHGTLLLKCPSSAAPWSALRPGYLDTEHGGKDGPNSFPGWNILHATQPSLRKFWIEWTGSSFGDEEVHSAPSRSSHVLPPDKESSPTPQLRWKPLSSGSGDRSNNQTTNLASIGKSLDLTTITAITLGPYTRVFKKYLSSPPPTPAAPRDPLQGDDSASNQQQQQHHHHHHHHHLNDKENEKEFQQQKDEAYVEIGSRCFSLHTGERTIDLIAPNVNDFEAWVLVLAHLTGTGPPRWGKPILWRSSLEQEPPHKAASQGRIPTRQSSMTRKSTTWGRAFSSLIKCRGRVDGPDACKDSRVRYDPGTLGLPDRLLQRLGENHIAPSVYRALRERYLQEAQESRDMMALFEGNTERVVQALAVGCPGSRYTHLPVVDPHSGALWITKGELRYHTLEYHEQRRAAATPCQQVGQKCPRGHAPYDILRATVLWDILHEEGIVFEPEPDTRNR